MASNDSDEYSLWENSGSIDQQLTEVKVDSDPGKDGGKTHTFSSFPASAVDDDDEEETSDSAGLLEKKSSPVWSFDFYKELFNVDTHVVLGRIKGSVLPRPSSEFTRNYIGGHPDLYGPFWICATLVMTIAICGNLTTLLNRLDDQSYHYSPEFRRLVVAIVIVYGYASILPLLVKGAFFFAKLESSSGYLDILCLYGYSMFVYIPLCLLLLIPNCTVEWILVAVAALISGAVIAISLWPLMREGSRNKGIIILLIVLAAHFAFSLSFRLYFFGSINCSGSSTASNSTLVPTTIMHTTTLSTTPAK